MVPGSIILIHIDTKLDWKEYETSELKSLVEDKDCLTCGADVLVESLFNIEWGRWSMNDPTHWSKSYRERLPFGCRTCLVMFILC